MKASSFDQQVEAAYDRLKALERYARKLPRVQQVLVSDIQKEVSTILEELQVTREEWYEQSEELFATREAVEVERQRYRELFEFAPDGYLVTDPEGIIQEANRATAILLNVPQSFLMGKPLSIYVARANRGAFRVQLARLKSGSVDGARDWEIMIQPRKGAPFFAAITIGVVCDTHSTLIGLRWLIRDITERKQIERERLELALEKEKILTDFISDASHDLRSPLSVIKTILYLLGKSTDPEMRSERLEGLAKEVAYLEDLVEDMLTMSRLDSRTDHVAGSFNLNGLINLIEAKIAPLARQKQLVFTFRVDDDIPVILGNELEIHRALNNLVENAISYTPEMGSVSVHARMNENHVVIEIRDTGIGIGDVDLPHIFERFYRVDKARTSRGAGLGLPIAKKIIEAHHGRIEVESALGEGSTFRVFLPVDNH